LWLFFPQFYKNPPPPPPGFLQLDFKEMSAFVWCDFNFSSKISVKEKAKKKKKDDTKKEDSKDIKEDELISKEKRK
jgi:hypothetical protein